MCRYLTAMNWSMIRWNVCTTVFKIRTICHSNSFRPFKIWTCWVFKPPLYWTSPVFRSQLYHYYHLVFSGLAPVMPRPDMLTKKNSTTYCSTMKLNLFRFYIFTLSCLDHFGTGKLTAGSTCSSKAEYSRDLNTGLVCCSNGQK